MFRRRSTRSRKKEFPRSNPLEILQRAVTRKPRLEVKARRVGGAPTRCPWKWRAIASSRSALRWLVDFADARKGQPMKEALAAEILEGLSRAGKRIRKRDEVHKMAQATKPSRISAGETGEFSAPRQPSGVFVIRI